MMQENMIEVARKAEPRKILSHKIRKNGFITYEMETLGCKIVAKCKYSFNPDFYKDTETALFDTELLTRVFNLYPLESYTTAFKSDVKEIIHSNEIKSSESSPIFLIHYPMFLFRYVGKHGWWEHESEPYYRVEKDNNCEFVWWHEQGEKPNDYFQEIYGDNDVMFAIHTGEVGTSDPEGHPLENVERDCIENNKKSKKQVKLFKRIVICSNLRNAINVYFHSDAHVVFPCSENMELSESTIDKLVEIANEVFVLYDIDRNGTQAMNNLALKNLDVKVIYLPENLATLNNPRNGKPCKDVVDFFNFYPEIMRNNDRFREFTINSYFENLMLTALPMRFWKVEYQWKRDEYNNRIPKERYTLKPQNLIQFLTASNFYAYTDEFGATGFVYIQNNIVDVVDKKNDSVKTKAKKIMIDFLKLSTKYYNTDLINTIHTCKISQDIKQKFKKVKLNFCSWGKDFEYFFFRNCAIKVTTHGIDKVDYIDLPFHVNRDAILNHDYKPLHESLFIIEENPQYKERKDLNRLRKDDESRSEDEKIQEEAEFAAYQRAHRFLLRFPKEIDEMPMYIQWLYDTSRIYWRKGTLTDNEKQYQDMHFVCKVALIGYMLSRYNSDKTPKMAVIANYPTDKNGKTCDVTATGRSLFLLFFNFVRKVCLIDKNLKSNNTANCLTDFRTTVDSMCIIDDISENFIGNKFYETSKDIKVKTIFGEKMTIRESSSPKILATIKDFDINGKDIQNDIVLAMLSDYYHYEIYNEVTPYTKFGKDFKFGNECTEEERNEAIYMMLQCCQFYLGLQECLIPPKVDDGIRHISPSILNDRVFINWADHFFASEHHWKRPISIQDMAMSLLKFRGEDILRQNLSGVKRDMKNKMKVYCDQMGYVMNPPITKRNDKSSDVPRHYAWETEFINDKQYKKEREKKHTRVCFFYRSLNEVPKDSSEILPCPNIDEEMEEISW